MVLEPPARLLLAQKLWNIRQDCRDVLVGQVAFEAVTELDCSLVPHQDGNVGAGRDLVVGWSILLSGHREWNLLDLGVLGEFLESLFGAVAVLGNHHDEALETSILGNLLVDLLDQTGQGLRCLAGKHADHRSRTVVSPIAERLALVRARDILDVERIHGLTGFQA